MFYNDHNPPHFHVIYQDSESLIDIKTLEVLEGNLSKRAKSLAIEWAIEHREELMANWQKAMDRKPLDKIEPLD